MSSQVCVDAGILIKVVVPEERSDLAVALWDYWIAEELELVAPPLFWYEVTAVLRKKVYRDLLTQEEGEEALTTALDADVQALSPPDLHRRAWELTTHFKRPTAYDAHYLALAEMLKCELWTADEHLFNVVSNELSWVNWLGDFEPNG